MNADIIEKLAGKGFYIKNQLLTLETTGKEVSLSTVSGEVVGMSKEIHQVVSGGGGTITTSSNGRIEGYIDPISTTNTEKLNFFVKNGSVENPIQLTDSGIHLRDGHEVTLMFSHIDNRKPVMISLVNHTTKIGYPFYDANDGKSAKIMFGVASKYGLISMSIGLMLSTIILGFLFFGFVQLLFKIPDTALYVLWGASVAGMGVNSFFMIKKLYVGASTLRDKMTSLHDVLLGLPHHRQKGDSI